MCTTRLMKIWQPLSCRATQRGAGGRRAARRLTITLETVTSVVHAEEFEALRPHLLAVAIRMAPASADAEDVVQEAWLRWHALGSGRDAVGNLHAWLTTVVSRLSLDRLRSAAHRRESYVGQRPPEPVVTTAGDASDPLSAVVAHEDARLAATVVLERLSADQRVAFVLHDGFGVGFNEVAELLDTTASAARQLASRARRAVADSASPLRHSASDEVVGALSAAMAAGDVVAVVETLHPDITTSQSCPDRRATAPGTRRRS